MTKIDERNLELLYKKQLHANKVQQVYIHEFKKLTTVCQLNSYNNVGRTGIVTTLPISCGIEMYRKCIHSIESI